MAKRIKIFRAYRLPDWWNFIFPQVLGFAYLQFFLYDLLVSNVYKDLLLFFVSFVGTASYGFFLNDITDIKEDKIAGKKNAAAEMSVPVRYLLLAASVLVAVLPWFFLKANSIALGLFICQMLLLFLYSTPPVRIKRNKFAGLISDALYSSVFPAFIAIFLFSKQEVFSEKYMLLWIVIFIGMLLLGLRSHIMHQIRDYDHDVRINAKNFVVSLGIERSRGIIYKILMPLEIINVFVFWGIFLSFKTLLWHHYLIFAVLLVVYIFSIFRSSNKDGYFFNFLNDVYGDLLPLYVLILLCFFSKYYILLLVIHFLVFQNKPIFLLTKHIMVHYVYHECIVWLYYKMFCNRYIKKIYAFLNKLFTTKSNL